MKHQKLVRDLIPDIIRKQGQVAHTRILPEGERALALADKLVEEAMEYRSAVVDGLGKHDQAEELADLMEVLAAALRQGNIPHKQVAQLRQAKRAQRGGFEEFVYLEETT